MMKHDDTSTTESGSDLLDVANNEKSNLIISDISNRINNSYNNTEPYHHQFDESHDRSSFDHHHRQQQQQHLGSSRQYWRDIILGVNDGIISTFLLISGVVGSQMNCREILLTSISGSLAGAVSMCAGEFIATKSQNEVMVGEISLEKYHIENNMDDELNELYHLFPLIGIDNNNIDLQNQLIQHYKKHKDSLLKIMKTLEFGIIEVEVRSPIMAGFVSCSLYLMGSIPSIIPFIYIAIFYYNNNHHNDDDDDDGSIIFKKDNYDVNMSHYGLIFSALFTTFSLLLVGAVKTWATRGNCFKSAIENFVIAGFGGILAYTFGIFFSNIVKG